MSANIPSASVYTDFQGLQRLKAAAGQQTPEAIEETARQFEAIFMQSMLKAMRDATPGEGLFESDQTKFYQQMYDQQLALHMVNGRGLGISKMLQARIGETQPVVSQAPGAPLVSLDNARHLQPLVNVATSADTGKDWQPQSPQEFINDLYPHVSKAAADIGVDPQVLIAQSALETGWGRKVIRHADGRSSFNLFNIKADTRWSGDSVRVDTLEYVDGMARKENAAFRSYASITEAVTDYVDFLKSNPRYTQALEVAGDTDSFLHGLKDAGYATDPAYVEKIKSILQRGTLAAQGSGAVTAAEYARGNGPG